MPNHPTAVQCTILDTGHCLAHEHHMLRGGRRVQVRCHSTVALLRHPMHGWGLWDAGYAPRMLDATRRWPFLLYRRATPLRLDPRLAVTAQLGRWGLTTDDIGWVILSHMHADHVAGLRDFPRATPICSADAYEDARGRSGLGALLRAVIPALLPADLGQRAQLLSRFDGPQLPGLGRCHDLFGDGALRLVPLPGHARGQLGLLAETTGGAVLFAADACWLTRAIRERRTPHPLTYLFVDDRAAVRATIERLHAFAQAAPDVRLVPSHCPEAFAREVTAF
jgi:glyoxylase-like metal-dependent hydrolase (beta-lactamase superfamily II)